MKAQGIIKYEGYTYQYEYRAAKHGIDICLATQDPEKYCNGFFLYSDKDPGNGLEYVVIGSDNPNHQTRSLSSPLSLKEV
jgi:hypothetical protein